MWKGIGRRWRWSRWGGGEYKGGNRGGSCLYAEGVGGSREVVSTRAETAGFLLVRGGKVTSHYHAGLQARKPDGFLALRHSPHTRKEKRTDW